MLPAVTRTAIAATTALALAIASAAPAQALGKNERNVLKGIFAAVVINELIKQGRSHAQPAPAPIPVQPQPYPHPDYNRTAAAAAFHEFSPQARRMIQQRLAAYGYYRGGIDGTWGRGTAAAVQAYARDVKSAESLASRDGSIRLFNHLIG